MMETIELDKTLNRESGFKHISFDPTTQVRLLRISHGDLIPAAEPTYSLEIVSLDALPQTSYKALSYTWGLARMQDDIGTIRIDGRTFFVRRNLADFLDVAARRGTTGLFFIDAVCIDQLDDDERKLQVRHMARVYRNADAMIAWLGQPDPAHIASLRALTDAVGRPHTAWTSQQWEGHRYLSHHRYWTRMWVLQEVLLAPRMRIWCGGFTFPATMLGSMADGLNDIRCGELTVAISRGRPEVGAGGPRRGRTPADVIISHRTRRVLKPCRDALEAGTKVGTLEEMTRDLRRPTTRAVTYQSYVADDLHTLMRLFRSLECTDPRDRLYGLLGLLDERTAASIVVDYTKDVDFVFRQALKAGLSWSRMEYRGARTAYLAFYCNVRDAFGIDDEAGLAALREVLQEVRFRDKWREAMFEAQWNTVWDGVEARQQVDDLDDLLDLVEMEDPAAAESGLYRFHERQRRAAQKVMKMVSHPWRRRTSWQRIPAS